MFIYKWKILCIEIIACALAICIRAKSQYYVVLSNRNSTSFSDYIPCRNAKISSDKKTLKNVSVFSETAACVKMLRCDGATQCCGLVLRFMPVHLFAFLLYSWNAIVIIENLKDVGEILYSK